MRARIFMRKTVSKNRLSTFRVATPNASMRRRFPALRARMSKRRCMRARQKPRSLVPAYPDHNREHWVAKRKSKRSPNADRPAWDVFDPKEATLRASNLVLRAFSCVRRESGRTRCAFKWPAMGFAARDQGPLIEFNGPSIGHSVFKNATRSAI